MSLHEMCQRGCACGWSGVPQSSRLVCLYRLYGLLRLYLPSYTLYRCMQLHVRLRLAGWGGVLAG